MWLGSVILSVPTQQPEVIAMYKVFNAVIVVAFLAPIALAFAHVLVN